MADLQRQLRIYRLPDQRVPYIDWLDGLKDRQARQQIQARMGRLRLGNFGQKGSVGEGVQELKVDYGPGYRVYFGLDGQTIVVLLTGGDKSTQDDDIKEAKSIGANTKRKKRMPTIDYSEHLLADLQDLDYAAGYLTAALEEGEDVFLLAVRDVVQAHGGINSLSQATSLNRENLYAMLSKEGNPRLSSLAKILNTLGLAISFVPKSSDSSVA